MYRRGKEVVKLDSRSYSDFVETPTPVHCALNMFETYFHLVNPKLRQRGGGGRGWEGAQSRLVKQNASVSWKNKAGYTALSRVRVGRGSNTQKSTKKLFFMKA